MVTSAGPGGLVRGGQQGVDLVVGQVGHQVLVDTLGWDGQDPLDDGGVLGMGQRGEPEQGVHRGEPGVAGSDAVATLALQMIQEGADQVGV
jgi:hypothetical protein